MGKPIIAHVIESALQSGLFQEVMVSTDTAEIAIVAPHYEATVPFMRSPENADDHVATVDVSLEVMDADAERRQTFEHICYLYPTSPFVTTDILLKTYQVLLSAGGEKISELQAHDIDSEEGWKIAEFKWTLVNS